MPPRAERLLLPHQLWGKEGTSNTYSGARTHTHTHTPFCMPLRKSMSVTTLLCLYTKQLLIVFTLTCTHCPFPLQRTRGNTTPGLEQPLVHGQSDQGQQDSLPLQLRRRPGEPLPQPRTPRLEPHFPKRGSALAIATVRSLEVIWPRFCQDERHGLSQHGTLYMNTP